ncbi:hypothetical protein EJ05DRAFT_26911 [Pseudovirgaria hyperparasitica]|uniref:Zn(2)-C6 fungal-type domain-containing protein n=1 Tax=Pseudovirgaria hyperparasitica TaxID=470096 RepID=A0A6A6WLQ0_9PEZI|nr:uncharacterized protein EJ05DRAFT_26911 [Pseudovirgaria hyperparasitica]KAF2763127.1 hypothetical protein EJ05DRAFT_26911 [Pseudovirgaria hyperparasitica]
MEAHQSSDPDVEGQKNGTDKSNTRNQANVSAKLRKRTKTGCLTCRKRRIKCGEERPICSNCIKSKRQCEGYNPRVVWKPPIGDWPGHASVTGTLPYHSGVIPGARPPDFEQYRPPGGPNVIAPHPPIQPRPITTQFDFANIDTGQIPVLAHDQLSPQTPHHFQQQHLVTPDHVLQSRQPVGGPYHQHSTEYPLQQSPQFQSPTYQYHNNTQPHTTFNVPGYYPTSSADYSQSMQPHISGPSASPYPDNPQSNFHHTMQPHVQSQGNYAYSQQSIYHHHPSISSEASVQFSGPPTMGNGASYTQVGNNYYSAVQEIPDNMMDGFNAYHSHDDRNSLEEQDIKLSTEQVFEPQPTRTQVDTKALEAQLVTYEEERETLTPTEILNRAAIEYHDDEYYDVDSDEDVDLPTDQAPMSSPKYQRDFTLIMRLYSSHTSDLAIRRMDAFIYEGILDHYHAEWVANPLKNEHTARVFAHFIHSSAPMLSIHERNPLNTQSMFSKTPVPASQQSLWTYTLPMMALGNQGLLHAMLAIGSLHIARLQGASITPSIKHYAYALKRIHHSVGHPKKRLQVTTFAASLLLGFYELMTADHLKWSSHLVGAKQLLVEIDYRGMTQLAKVMKAEQTDYDRKVEFSAYSLPQKPRPHAAIFRSDMPLPNEEILSTIIGKKLRYDELGRVIEDFETMDTKSIPRALDMTKFELFQDLFWWYCRQDAYQSIISGNKLLLDYSRWGDCPPRAPIGKSEAAYATHDHFILMLGRIADFAARDRDRKIQAIEAQGGAWKPDPRMFAALMGRPAGGLSPGMARPGSGMPHIPGAMGQTPYSGNVNAPQSGYPFGTQIANSMGVSGASTAAVPPFGLPGQDPQGGFPTGRPPTQPQGPPALPKIPFFGMAPSSSHIHMPSSYAKYGRKAKEAEPEDILDLEEALRLALEEWQQINAALNVFASNLGPQFQPLSAEYHQPVATPFGDAAQYRSYDICNIWALYNMARIITIRSHPCMPPAAMMAAGVAAAMTAPIANEIGRITAGISMPASHVPLNPSLGAALISSTMPLFFAGVQYTNADQRAWLIPRILDIETRTGFASAGLIAKGCEVAWQRAGEAGRGPPYTPYQREHASEERDMRKSGLIIGETTDAAASAMESGYVTLRDHSDENGKRFAHTR